MSRMFKMVSLLLALCMLCGIPFVSAGAEEVIDADLTCTITLGNWPPDTAPQAEKDLFENYKAIMAKQYPNVTLVPDYFYGPPAADQPASCRGCYRRAGTVRGSGPVQSLIC